VPGSPLDPRAEGTNGLIKQGATPVTETADIVSVLAPIMEQHELLAREPERDIVPGDRDPADDERARIVALLGPAPVQTDDLVRMAQSSPTVVRMVLLELEIAGRIERHGSGLVSLI
jgi:DNA processing protein